MSKNEAADEATQDDALPPGAAEGRYEFNSAQNELIRRLAGSIRFAGIVTLISGMLLLAAGIYAWMLAAQHQSANFGSGYSAMVPAAYLIAFGWLLIASAGHFGNVVETKGHDIAHLMSALERLRRAFNLQRLFVIGAMVLMFFVWWTSRSY